MKKTSVQLTWTAFHSILLYKMWKALAKKKQGGDLTETLGFS